MGNFWSIIQVIKALLDLWGWIKSWLSAKRKAKDEEKSQKRDAALEDAKNAQTPEEAYAAQERIVDNKP